MNYPQHIAVIPDGNRTWAKERHLPTLLGHKAGFDNMIELAKYAFSQTPVRAFTFWGLSTENTRQRTADELEYLYGFARNLKNSIKKMLIDGKISFRWIGNPVGLPADVVKILNSMQQEFSFGGTKTLVIAVNYGGRDEIMRGINNRLQTSEKHDLLTEDSLSASMDLGDIPVVDLVIRTKSHLASRLSGFMLWWIAYAELFFTDILFPDFGVEQLKSALQWYDERAEYRNFGK